jgi:hypothetical protein
MNCIRNFEQCHKISGICTLLQIIQKVILAFNNLDIFKKKKKAIVFIYHNENNFI